MRVLLGSIAKGIRCLICVTFGHSVIILSSFNIMDEDGVTVKETVNGCHCTRCEIDFTKTWVW